MLEFLKKIGHIHVSLILAVEILILAALLVGILGIFFGVGVYYLYTGNPVPASDKSNELTAGDAKKVIEYLDERAARFQKSAADMTPLTQWFR